jgi:hypothetical protein
MLIYSAAFGCFFWYRSVHPEVIGVRVAAFFYWNPSLKKLGFFFLTERRSRKLVPPFSHILCHFDEGGVYCKEERGKTCLAKLRRRFDID